MIQLRLAHNNTEDEIVSVFRNKTHLLDNLREYRCLLTGVGEEEGRGHGRQAPGSRRADTGNCSF